MKRTLTTIIILLITSTLFAQNYYINLGWHRANVKAQNRDLELIYKAKNYLEYQTETGYIAYEFTNRICTTAYICLDSIDGCRLIEQHEFKNWQPIEPDKWLYYAGYDKPVNVVADWFGGNVIFSYKIK